MLGRFLGRLLCGLLRRLFCRLLRRLLCGLLARLLGWLLCRLFRGLFGRLLRRFFCRLLRRLLGWFLSRLLARLFRWIRRVGTSNRQHDVACGALVRQRQLPLALLLETFSVRVRILEMVGAVRAFQPPSVMRDLQPNVPEEPNVESEVVAQFPGVMVVCVLVLPVVHAVVRVRARDK